MPLGFPGMCCEWRNRQRLKCAWAFSKCEGKGEGYLIYAQIAIAKDRIITLLFQKDKYYSLRSVHKFLRLRSPQPGVIASANFPGRPLALVRNCARHISHSKAMHRHKVNLQARDELIPFALS